MNHEHGESCGPVFPEKIEAVATELAERAAEATRKAGPLPILPMPKETCGPTVNVEPAGGENAAPPAAKPEVITRKQFKEYLRWHFTVRRSIVKACGHKINLTSFADPRHNCDSCWFAYFQNNGQMTQIADECFQNAGRDVLERSRGKRFVKYFLRIMSTIARFQREAAEAQKAQEKTNGEANVSGGGSATSGIDSVGSTEQSSGEHVTDDTQTIGGIPESGSPVDYIAEAEVNSEETA